MGRILGSGVGLHAFLTCELDGSWWSASCCILGKELAALIAWDVG